MRTHRAHIKETIKGERQVVEAQATQVRDGELARSPSKGNKLPRSLAE